MRAYCVAIALVCAKGFAVDKVFATPPKVNLGIADEDMAGFDPEWAPPGQKDVRLGYTCVRRR